MTTKPAAKLTLKDKLSRLTFIQACKLLKPQGEQLLRQGGLYEIDLDNDVLLNEQCFQLHLPDAKVSLRLDGNAKNRLLFHCSCGHHPCEHAAAVLTLILEEKTPLGLAKEPPEPLPVEPLNDEELTAQALQERQQRADKEKMRVHSLDMDTLWSDYLVTNASSGKTYRVALRGWEVGDSFCNCPDFRKNTLGTCKHILHTCTKVKKRFPALVRSKPYLQQSISVHLRYTERIELRLLLPENLPAAVEKMVCPLRDQAINNIPELLQIIQRLERLEQPVQIYPDAEEYLQRQLFNDHIATTVNSIRQNPQDHPLRKELLNATLLPYQLDGIAFAIGAGRAVLADEMGLGKTIQGIGVAELLAREAHIEKVLVISPASLKAQWREEIARFCHRDSQIVMGGAKQRAEQYQGEAFFTLCNYEQVLRDARLIAAQHWDLIILDEGQRIKNWEAKTSQTIKLLRSRFALVLTGTPLENRLDDLYSIIEFIDDRRLGPDFRFYNHHRVVDERGKVLGYKNLEELRKKLKPVLLRRTRASIRQQLPERSSEIIRIEPTEQQFDMHQGFRSTISLILRKRYLTEMDLLRLQKALLMCRMSANSTYLVDKQLPAYSSKLKTLDQLLGSLCLEEDRKMILFSEWTTMLNLIEPLLDKYQVGRVRLDGSVPQKKRQQLVHQFQNNNDCKMFLTTNAGATGLNLQAANTVINVDLPWNPALLEQRIARAHRMGQQRPVQVYILVTEQTLEENLLQTLSAKKQLAMAALDPDTNLDEVDLSSGLEELKRRLEVLLGATPQAPEDVQSFHRQTREKQRIEQQTRIANAGGQLLGAAFQFISEMLPVNGIDEADERTRQMAEVLEQRLDDCLQTTEDGQIQLTVNLPDKSTLSRLAGTMARMLAAQAL
ncbi:MAG TPA: helicase [Gammaproteobacteria bacterium]|nr:helicase [Gammaproteobacteria bacterium]